ncbi:MAG TPA: hypothetical protein PLQ11_05895 [Beijerinckiaceae bacterium]|nr:hypothetical protein [Beijerinckiaceae bacterium]
MKRLLRLFSFFSALAGFVLLVIDGTGFVATRVLAVTPLGDVLARLPAGTFGPLSRERLGALLPEGVWGSLEQAVLSCPAALAFGLAALLFWILGRKPPPDLRLAGRRWQADG